VSRVLAGLPLDLEAPVVVVLHLADDPPASLVDIFRGACHLPVRSAEDKLPIAGGTVYLAPPGYHLLVEADETFGLSVDPRVNFSRPAIDVLFESAADAWRGRLIGIVLTGAGGDGAMGAKRIRERGGYVIAQNPDEAEADRMPRAAIEAGAVDEVLPVDAIGTRAAALAWRGQRGEASRVMGRKSG
jgi:two-component system chemotaxis response regulator CheB